MNSVRKLIGFVLTLAVAAFALPGNAANEKLYTLKMTAASSPLTSGSSKQLTATFANVSPTGGANSSFNALKLVAPTGYVITKVLSVSSGVPTPAIGTSTSVTTMKVENASPVGKGGTFSITFLATVPGACTASRWNPDLTGDVWTGSQIGSGISFTNMSNGSLASTEVTGTSSIALTLATPIDTPSGSVVDGLPYVATAIVSSTCPLGDGVTVKFSGSAGVTVSPGSPTTGSDGVTTSTATFDTRGPATLKAEVPSLGVSKTLSFNVFDRGNLACEGSDNPLYPAIWDADLESYEFDGSPGIYVEDTIRFFKGVRGANILNYAGSQSWKNFDCIPLNYTYVNNVPGSGSDTTTQPGKTVPANAFALFYDEAAQPNATFRTLQTYRDEWTSASGWLDKRTKVCLDAGCGTRVVLKACLGTTLVLDSMPFFDSPQDTTMKMPVCVVSESWFAVPVPSCTAPESRPGNAACVRVTSELILVGDPVVPREQ